MNQRPEPTTLRIPAAPAAEGWHHPRGSRAAHYLRGGVSLCGRWVCHPSVGQVVRAPLSTDCAACRLQLGRRGGAGTRGPAA